MTERTHSQPFWLTGHSLGGAMAMIAAADPRKTDIDAAGVVTFGPSRPRDTAPSRKPGKPAPDRLIRYVSHVDAVAAITGPVAWPSMMFPHRGRVRFFDTTGRLHECR